jgi:hypothetical protein
MIFKYLTEGLHYGTLHDCRVTHTVCVYWPVFGQLRHAAIGDSLMQKFKKQPHSPRSNPLVTDF